jgi:16S rRNA processing protein RimM
MSSSHSRKSTSPGSDEPWDLLIGEICGSHGLHGDVRVYPHTDYPDRFAGLDEVGLRQGEGPVRVIRVTGARVQGRRIVLSLDGVTSIEQAEALCGAHLVLPRSRAVPLEEDEYFHFQLVGLEVVTTTGASLGRITDIWQTGANDVYETPDALIPATKDCIREIDLDSGRIVVDDRPGLRKRDSDT